jgi:catechol 2,3-dioxygenase-like lactoylglutathione lyase family enzyme
MEPNPHILKNHHITLSVGTAQEDYDFHTKVLGLKSVKKTAAYDGNEPIYYRSQRTPNASSGARASSPEATTCLDRNRCRWPRWWRNAERRGSTPGPSSSSHGAAFGGRSAVVAPY